MTDTERLDWLEKHFVEVRAPLRYGTRHVLMAVPSGDEDDEPGPSDLREKIDRCAS